MQDADEVTTVPIQSVDLCGARYAGGRNELEPAAGKVNPCDALEKCDIERATVTRERNAIGPRPVIGIGTQEDFQRVCVGRDPVEPPLICVRDEDVAVLSDREIIEEMAGARICWNVAAQDPPRLQVALEEPSLAWRLTLRWRNTGSRLPGREP